MSIKSELLKNYKSAHAAVVAAKTKLSKAQKAYQDALTQIVVAQRTVDMQGLVILPALRNLILAFDFQIKIGNPNLFSSKYTLSIAYKYNSIPELQVPFDQQFITGKLTGTHIVAPTVVVDRWKKELTLYQAAFALLENSRPLKLAVDGLAVEMAQLLKAEEFAKQQAVDNGAI